MSTIHRRRSPRHGTLGQRVTTLRRTIADLEEREAALLADLTTLEAAIAAMRQWVRAHETTGQPPATLGAPR